jgi:hypothetical protein
MWAPLVALQTSKQYSISWHIRPRTSGVTDAADQLIHCFKCSMLWIRTLQTSRFTYTQGCEVRRAWGPLLTFAPPNPAPWKCHINKFRSAQEHHLAEISHCHRQFGVLQTVPTCRGNCVMSQCTIEAVWVMKFTVVCTCSWNDRKKQEVLGRTNRLRVFDTTRTA